MIKVKDVIRARHKLEQLFKGDFNDPLYRAAHAEWWALAQLFSVERGFSPNKNGVYACDIAAKPDDLASKDS